MLVVEARDSGRLLFVDIDVLERDRSIVIVCKAHPTNGELQKPLGSRWERTSRIKLAGSQECAVHGKSNDGAAGRPESRRELVSSPTIDPLFVCLASMRWAAMQATFADGL